MAISRTKCDDKEIYLMVEVVEILYVNNEVQHVDVIVSLQLFIFKLYFIYVTCVLYIITKKGFFDFNSSKLA